MTSKSAYIRFDDIRKAAQFIASRADHVRFHQAALETFANELEIAQPKHWLEDWFQNNELLPHLSLREALLFVFIINTANYSFWGEPKWAITYKGRKLGGSLSLITCYGLAAQADKNFLDPERLTQLSQNEYTQIVNGRSEASIPLLYERWMFLRKAATFLKEQYGSDVLRLIEQNGTQAENILNALLEGVEEYRDIHFYEGQTLPILKLAQITVGDLDQIYKMYTGKKMMGTEQLTACADYKLPQSLRHAGILEYSESLSAKIDQEIELQAGSPEEVEIRLMAVQAVEEMRKYLKEKRNVVLTSKQINDLIWLRSQNAITGIKPYHRTRTVNY